MTARVKGGKPRRARVPAKPTERHRVMCPKGEIARRRCGTARSDLATTRTETVRRGRRWITVVRDRKVSLSREAQLEYSKRRRLIKRRRANRVARRSAARNRRRR